MKSGFFIFLLVVSQLALAQTPTTAPATQPGFEQIGHIDSPLIPESSGLVMSQQFPGTFWTQNDSGNPSQVFAITREGKLQAAFSIDAPNLDWEDIAIDSANRIYLADIGNNLRNRSQIQIYRIAEPDPKSPTHSVIKPDRIWRLTYPERPFDAESLCLLGDNGYIISKRFDAGEAGVYQFSLNQSAEPKDLVQIGTLPLRIPVTAADISLDKRFLAVMTVAGPSVYEIDGDMTRAGKKLVSQAIFLDPQVEAVCFVPGGLMGTTEGRRVVFFPMTFPTVPTTRP